MTWDCQCQSISCSYVVLFCLGSKHSGMYHNIIRNMNKYRCALKVIQHCQWQSISSSYVSCFMWDLNTQEMSHK